MVCREEDEGQGAYAVYTLLKTLGIECIGEEMKDTPKRVYKALKEMTSGYQMNPEDLLKVTFPSNYDEMVVVDKIPFTSLCCHHVLPFTGTATVGYIPKEGKVVGLSKIARLVDGYAKRLQIQERMTQDIAKAIEKYLDPIGVGIICIASHSCMSCRGVSKTGAKMVTSCLLGAMREGTTRNEFLRLAGV